MSQATNRSAIRDTNWPYTGIYVEDDEALYDVIDAIAEELARFDADVQGVSDDRFVQTATGEALDKLAREVNIRRFTETQQQLGYGSSSYGSAVYGGFSLTGTATLKGSDLSLRTRTLIAKSSKRADGTMDDVARVLSIIFEDDINGISLEPKADSPVTLFRIPKPVLDSFPLTQSEMETALDALLPLNDPIEIVVGDRFIFGESGNQGLGGKLS